jgi:hypothetical protein
LIHIYLYIFYFKENEQFHLISVAVLLMNKLYEEKRYEDVKRVHNRIYTYYSNDFNMSISELFLDALVEQVCCYLYHLEKKTIYLNLIYLTANNFIKTNFIKSKNTLDSLLTAIEYFKSDPRLNNDRLLRKLYLLMLNQVRVLFLFQIKIFSIILFLKRY